MHNTDKTGIPEQRARLAAWLNVYRLDRHLRDDTVSASCPEPPTAAHEQPDPGQIRLLPPVSSTPPEYERPIYILVTSATQPGIFTVIPFSRFDMPATPQEWTTQWPETPLQVLCFWNARSVAARALQATWLVSRVSELQLRQVIEAGNNSTSPAAYPVDMRCGPPLVHPLDPRHVYLQEERSLLDDAIGTLEQSQDMGKSITYEIHETDIRLLRAAEGPADTESGKHTD